ncbi:MAG: transporter substrate-binding domain-containing protein [Alphaproteobacteria bacterium]
MKWLKNIILCLPLLLSGCGEKADEASGDGTQLVMVTSADYPPFEFYDTSKEDCNVIGFDVDLVNEISKHIGATVRVMDVEFAGVLPAMLSGRADFAMAGISPTPQREQNMMFSDIYYNSENVLLTLKGVEIEEVQNNGQIGVQLGSTQEVFGRKWQETHPNTFLVKRNKVIEMVQELRSKRMDAVLVEKTIAQAFVGKYPEDLEIHSVQDDDSGIAIAFPKGSEELVAKFNEALKHLEASGELQKLRKKWFT